MSWRPLIVEAIGHIRGHLLGVFQHEQLASGRRELPEGSKNPSLGSMPERAAHTGIYI